MPDKQFAKAEKMFRANCFGYADYNAPEVFNEQQSYGISLSSPAYVASLLQRDQSIRLRGYIERGWVDHQDVVIFQKLPING